MRCRTNLSSSPSDDRPLSSVGTSIDEQTLRVMRELVPVYRHRPDVGAPLATRVLCAGRGVWCSYRPKFEIGVVELLARKRKLAIAPGTTGTRPLGGRTEMPEFGDPSKSRTSRFRAVNTPLGYFGLYGDEDEHAQTF